MKLFDLRNKIGNKWIWPFAALIFCVFLINCLPVVLGAKLSILLFGLSFISSVTYLYFRGVKGGAEIRLLFLFGVWLVLSRIINGDYFLSQDTVQTLLLCMLFVLPAAGLVLSKDGRRRFLLCAGIVVCVIYTASAVLGIYSAVSGVELINPRDGSFITQFSSVSDRLEVFGRNPNYISVCFMVACFFALYFFANTKRAIVKAIIILVFILNYVAIGLTYSRNVMLGSSLAFAALLYLPLQEKMRIKNVRVKVAALLVVMCICTPLIYNIYTASRSAVNFASEIAAPEVHVVVEKNSETTSLSEKTDERRGMKDTGRLPIWRSVLPVLKNDPGRLLAGRVNVMDASNAYFEEQWFGHGNKEFKVLAKTGGVMYYHNAFIQLLMATGIPGLLIVLAFLALLAVHACRVFFAQEGKTAAGDKILALLLAALVCYNMFECSIFCNITLASVTFFIVSGFVIAASKEIKSMQ